MFPFRKKPKHDPAACDLSTCEDAECKAEEARQQVLNAAQERVKSNPPTKSMRQEALRLLRDQGPALAALLLLIGCSPGRGYVAADRATYDAIAAEYVAFVDSSALPGDAKGRRHKTVESWAARLEQAEKGKGE